MQLQKASRKKASIKMSLQGPSGSGKTYSSLLIAYGLCGKYAVVDHPIAFFFNPFLC